MDRDQIKQRCLKPISGDSPVGEDPKYDPLFEGIRGEISKMGGIGHGAPDWDKVVEDSLTLLENNAKEFNLITYLVAGLATTKGLPGLVAGLDSMLEFLQAFWQEMFPPLTKKKIKIRARAVEWLNERFNDLQSDDAFQTTDRELLTEAIDLLERLKELVFECFDEPPANFKSLKGHFEEALRLLPEPEPEPEPESGEEEAETPPSEAPEEPSQPPPSEPKPKPSARPATHVEVPAVGEDASLDDVLEVLGKLAASVREAAPQAPASYRMRRMAAWTGVGLPRHESGGETMIPAPVEELRGSLKAMMGKASWMDLLNRCESLTSSWPFWLDLQFFAATAAENLGEPFTAVHRAIASETHDLCQRLPQILDLKFDDGTPFASTQTRDWAAHLGSLLGGGGGSKDPVAELRSAIMQKGVDQYGEALKLAQEHMDRTVEPREKWHMQLEVAGFCLEAQQHQWALAMLQALTRVLKHHHIGDYEPRFAARVWSTLIKTCRALREEEMEVPGIEEEAMRELANLNLELAGQLPAKNRAAFGS